MTLRRSTYSVRGIIAMVMGGVVLSSVVFGFGGPLSRSRPAVTALLGTFMLAYGIFLFRLGRRRSDS